MKLPRSAVAGLALGMLAVLAPWSAAAEDATLRYKFKEGETLQYAAETKMGIQVNAGGVNQTIETSQNIDMSWKVNSLDGKGRAKVTMTFDRLRMTMNAGQAGKVDYDSKEDKVPEGPIGQALAPVLKAIKGAEFTFTMDPRGTISDVKVPEKLKEAIKDAAQGGGGFGDMFSEDTLKQMTSILSFPEGPVTKGKPWQNQESIKTPFGKMKVDTKATYEGTVDRGGAKLDKVALEPSFKVEGEAASAGPLTDLKLTGQESKGTAYFDREAGRVVETELNTTMEMGFSAGGQNGTMKIEQNVTMKLVGTK